MLKDFAAFILTHGRADNVITCDSLHKRGYTGPIFLVVDDEDSDIPKYIDKYGKDKVMIFNKDEIAKEFDLFDSTNRRGVIVYARNACFKIARKLGYTYFIQLDDDYTDFRYKIDGESNYINRKSILSLDNILEAMLEYYKAIPAAAIAMAQGGDFLLGAVGGLDQVRKRKCMNTFICSTNRPFTFNGRINEDVNTYTAAAARGTLFLTIPFVAINQVTSQTSAGGMTDAYLDAGTYIKSFYTIICMPSAVVVSTLRGRKYTRLHHRISWRYTTPKIIPESYRKAEA